MLIFVKFQDDIDISIYNLISWHLGVGRFRSKTSSVNILRPTKIAAIM